MDAFTARAQVSGTNTSDVQVVGAQATLAGTGTITGGVLVNGGTIAPGATAGAVGTLTVGSLTFDGGTYTADVIGDTFDQIRTAGPVNLQSGAIPAVFNLVTSGTQTPGSVYTFIRETSSGPIAPPNFSGINEGSTAPLSGGQTGLYSYTGGPGSNNFTLTVPFPGHGDFVLKLDGTGNYLDLFLNNVLVDHQLLASITVTPFRRRQRAHHSLSILAMVFSSPMGYFTG